MRLGVWSCAMLVGLFVARGAWAQTTTTAAPTADCVCDPSVVDGDPEYSYDPEGSASGERCDCRASSQPLYDDGYSPAAYAQFEPVLAPYGEWIDYPPYGRVWLPSPSYVGYDFTPYATAGHWELTEYGWTWVSDYYWGWAPFHYGRWLALGGYGWCWIPGSLWGPGWVSWRYGGGYVGWAALPPAGVRMGPPPGVRSSGGVTIGAPSGTRSPWRFVMAGEMGQPRQRFLPVSVVASVWRGTRSVHNDLTVPLGDLKVRVNAGPPPGEIGAAVGRPLVPATLREVAPSAVPRAEVTPRQGTPVTERPWAAAAQEQRLRQPVTLGAGGDAAPPSYTQPSYTQPSYTQPSYTQPSYTQPSYTQPSYTQPSYTQPRSTYVPPPPTYTPPPRPIYTQPSYTQPSYTQPSYTQPSYTRPSYTQPSYTRPSITPPSTNYSRPSYTPTPSMTPRAVPYRR